MKVGESNMTQPQGLIEVLLDVTAAEADRDDAAMDLSTYDDPEVEEALIRVGVEPSTPRSVAASCGESLAEIWLRKGKLNLSALKLLRSEARDEALALISAREPSWTTKTQWSKLIMSNTTVAGRSATRSKTFT
jgi:hypothetical protein